MHIREIYAKGSCARWIFHMADGQVFERPCGFEIKEDQFGMDPSTCWIDMGDSKYLRPLDCIVAVEPAGDRG
jgi:hypothetical protein